MKARYDVFLVGVVALIIVTHVYPLFAATVDEVQNVAPKLPPAGSGSPIPKGEEDTEKNPARSANMHCASYIYPLKCGVTNPETRRIGGQGCPCRTPKIAGHSFRGHCEFNKEKGEGVCKSDEYSENDDGNVTDGSPGSAGDSGATPPNKPDVPPPAQKPTVPQKPSDVGKPISDAFNKPKPSVNTPSKPTAPSGSQSGSNSGSNPGYSSSNNGGGGSGVGSAQPSAFSGIPFSYPNVSPYQLLAQNRPGSPIPTLAYNDAPTDYAFNNGSSFNSQDVDVRFVPKGPMQDYKSFLALLEYAGDTTKREFDTFFKNFSNNDQSILPTEGSFAVADGENVQSDFTGSMQPKSQYELSDQVQPPEAVRQAFNDSAQNVRHSLRELGETILSFEEPPSQEEVRTEDVPTTEPSTPPLPSIDSDTVSGSPSTREPQESTRELEAAEERVALLQTELENDREQRKYTDEKIKVLTAELDALNDRLQTVNEVLTTEDFTKGDRDSLIDGIITNVQLTLEYLETRLLEESARGTTRTTGEVIAHALFSNVTGFIDWTVDVNRSVLGRISSFFSNMFSNMFGIAPQQ